MMRVFFRHCLVFILVVGVLLLAASLGAGARRQAGGGAETFRAVLFVNGTLGDKSFYDSAARGLKNAKSSLGIDARIVEGGTDPTRWESALTDLVDGGDFDVIITGTFTMVPTVQKLAAQYPHVRFIVFDAAVDYAKCSCSNVYSILFRQNEGAYLAGYLAARLAALNTSVNSVRQVGVIGGMQIPVIEDFIVGFTAGARTADPAIRVSKQYVNSFSDPATAKEIAKALFGQGSKVLFHAAGASGQGVIEAAAEAERYVIGVDSDQYALYRASSPQRAAWIATSVLKNVDVAIFRALRLHLARQVPYGHAESLGVAEQGIALSRHSEVLNSAPRELVADIVALEQRMASGRIEVPSAFTVAR
jgi:basic membrane protein A